MDYVKSRINEPSTYAGIAGILYGLTPFFAGGAQATVATVAESVAGVAQAPSAMNLVIALISAFAVLKGEKRK